MATKVKISRREFLTATTLLAASAGLGWEYAAEQKDKRERQAWFAAEDLTAAVIAKQQRRLKPQLRNLLTTFGFYSFSQFRTVHGPDTWAKIIAASANAREYPLVELDLGQWNQRPVIAHDPPTAASPDFFNAIQLLLNQRQIIKLDLKDQNLFALVPQLIAKLLNQNQELPTIINWSVWAQSADDSPSNLQQRTSRPIILSPDFFVPGRGLIPEFGWNFISHRLQNWGGVVMLPWPLLQIEKHWPLLQETMDRFGTVLYAWDNKSIRQDDLRNIINLLGGYRVRTIFDIPDQRLSFSGWS